MINQFQSSVKVNVLTVSQLLFSKLVILYSNQENILSSGMSVGCYLTDSSLKQAQPIRRRFLYLAHIMFLKRQAAFPLHCHRVV